MKVEKSVMIINGIALGIGFLLLLSSGFDSSAIGILAILLAFMNFILLIIFSIMGNRSAMLNALILTGILFTIGFSICSSSTMNMH